MRAAAALGFLLALGVWVGHALAAPLGLTQLPTTSLPITTVIPTVPTTLPKLPTTTTIPAPPKLPTTTTVPAPPKLPTTTAPATTTAASQAVSTATTAADALKGQSAASTSGLQGSPGPGAGGSGGQASPGNSGAQGLQSSRPYIAKSGPKKRQRIILSFVLSQGGRVYFVIKQVSPDCRVAGRFSVRGHQGANRVRFTGKVAGKPLSPGTYLISATTRHSARVLRLTLVVVDRGTPTPAALRAALAANVCPPEPDSFLGAAPSAGGSFGTGFTGGAKPALDTASPGRGTGESASVLGTALQRAAAEAVKPLAVTLLGLAILLLGLAAAPKAVVPGARLNDVLVRHRPEITAAGAAAMVTGILYVLIS
jgi:hypothetical protein